VVNEVVKKLLPPCWGRATFSAKAVWQDRKSVWGGPRQLHRSSELPRSRKLTTISFAGCARIPRATTPGQNAYLLQRFIHQPDHRSQLILDLDSTVITVFGRQEGAAVGYNPRYRGKRSYDLLLCLEANSSLLWDVELRRGDAGT
jgi:hypothetical protein